jgi:hypothetical protein
MLPTSVPNHHNDLGNAYADHHRFVEAESAYRHAISLRPDYAEAHANLGHVLLQTHRLVEAEAVYRRAIRLQPHFLPVYADLANLLRLTDRTDEAATVLDATEKLSSPPAPELYVARHLLHQWRHEWDAAGRVLDTGLANHPHRPHLHLCLAMHHLLLGDLERGFAEYEWRWKSPVRRGDLRPFPQPLWDGTPRLGRRLLLHCEQGLGTTFQFARYALLLAQQGYDVTLECQPPLKNILSCLSPAVRIIARGEPAPDFDTHAPLLSVPRILRTSLRTIPASVPYIHPDAQLVERWRHQLARLPGLKVGIAWQGNPHHPDDRRRSIPLKHFAPLAAVKNVTLVSLQQVAGLDQIPAAAENVPLVDLVSRLDLRRGPFTDVSAMMKSLDLVVTNDTSIAHLAGALGVPVWVALSHVPDWRWLVDRDDSPWYPTMRLFRQRQPGDWADVFGRIAGALGRCKTDGGCSGSKS